MERQEAFDRVFGIFEAAGPNVGGPTVEVLQLMNKITEELLVAYSAGFDAGYSRLGQPAKPAVTWELIEWDSIAVGDKLRMTWMSNALGRETSMNGEVVGVGAGSKDAAQFITLSGASLDVTIYRDEVTGRRIYRRTA
jgi:hypothetical protein